MASQQWFLYLLECNDGSVYTGVTTDIAKRMNAHTLGKGSKYVASRGFKQMISFKEMESKSAALKQEYAIKQLSASEKRDWFVSENYALSLSSEKSSSLSSSSRSSS